MRGRNITCTVEVDGQRLDESVLTCLTSGDEEQWFIDLSTVLSLLDLIAREQVDPRAVREALRCAASWDSGCCGECDDAAGHHAEARRRHVDAVQRWNETRRELDPDTYPYLLNKGRLHRLGCPRPPTPRPPSFPENLHAFAVLFDGYGRTLDSVLDAMDERSARGAEQISVADVLGMIARDGQAAVTARVCRGCKPSLPWLDPTHPAVQPACWGWAVDAVILDQLRAATTESSGTGVNVLPEQRAAYAMLERWHDGRCAICGETPVGGGLVRDHDHDSGLMRGLLCSPCNIAEGRTDALLFENYRRRPPCAILGVEVLYLPPGFRPGLRHAALTAG